jgi:OmpA-OmpF porin, OOP family
MRKLLLGAVLVLASATVGAQDRGFYVGGAIGQATVQDFCEGVSGPGVSCDEKDNALKAIGGYHFNRNFALELGLTSFGEVEARGPGGTVSVTGGAFDATAVGVLPLANVFSLYGRLGLYYAAVEGEANTFTVTGTEEETNIGLTFALGARFDIARNFTIRGEWQRYQDVGGGNLGEADVDVISVGVLFRF